jgi:hypothetical protein
LDHGIDDTFVSSVREDVSFALIDFQVAGWRKAVCLRHEGRAVDTKVWAIPSSNCAAHFVLAQWWQLYVAGWFVSPERRFRIEALRS